MSRHFGELEVHPMRPQGEFPEILVLDNNKDNPVLSTDVWHSDTTFRRNPTKYTILRCQIMPEVGGDTLWADMEAAYDGLSNHFKKLIDGLKAVHDFQNFRVLFKKTEEDQARLRKMEELFPNPSHPVVRTHPVTGRKCIFVNPQFTVRIEDMEPDESRAILQVLFAQAQVPEYQIRLRWNPGTMVFWDNRSTQHYAANDYYPERRRMERTAVIGDVPVMTPRTPGEWRGCAQNITSSWPTIAAMIVLRRHPRSRQSACPRRVSGRSPPAPCGRPPAGRPRSAAAAAPPRRRRRIDVEPDLVGLGEKFRVLHGRRRAPSRSALSRSAGMPGGPASGRPSRSCLKCTSSTARSSSVLA